MLHGHSAALSDFVPLLLALPRGTVAGLLTDAAGVRAAPGALAPFGPWLHSEAELRRAAFDPPPRVVVSLAPAASLASDAALAALAERGAAVALLSADPGTLLRCCDRVGLPGPLGPRWAAPEVLRRCRVLALRVVGSPGSAWIRVPLRRERAEVVLAACRARGLTVAESRVEYDWRPSR